MKKLALLGAIALMTATLSLQSCTNEIIDDQRTEDYVQAYLNKYGKPADGHSFNTAVLGKITVKSKTPTNVKVLAYVTDKFYLFADWNVDGSSDIKFNIPAGITDIMLYTEDGRMVPGKLGTVIDLDNPVKSRAEGWDPTPNEDTDVYVPVLETCDNGLIHRVDTTDFAGRLMWEDACPYPSIMRGSELKKFVSNDASTYASYSQFTDNYADFTYPWFNMHILNINLPTDEEYEIGVVFGNSNDMRTSTQLTYIPVYNSKYVVDNHSTQYYFGDRPADYPFANAGAEITIDFSKNGEAGSTKYTHTDVFKPGDDSFAAIAKDNIDNYPSGSLESKIAAQYAVQSQIPNIYELVQRGSALNYWGIEPVLPAVPEGDEAVDFNKWDFYGNYDAFIESWLNQPANAEVKAALPTDHYQTLREVFGQLRMCIPDNAYPVITRDETNPRKYTLTYYTAWAFDMGKNCYETTRTNTAGIGTSMYPYPIDENKYYASSLVQVRVPDCYTSNQHPFTIYMWNKKTGKIVTTANGAHAKWTSWAPTTVENGVQTSSGYSVDMVDFDDDGIYNDFVFIWSHPGGYHPGPTFEPYTWLIACEDLGSKEDYDFNDAVFKVKFVQTNSMMEERIEISPMCAGGIMPLYLMFSDPYTGKNFVVGREIHKWLGGEKNEDGTYPMMYTDCDTYTFSISSSKVAKFIWDRINHGGNDFYLESSQNALWGTEGTMAGFWVLADRKGVLESKLDYEDPSEFHEIELKQVQLTGYDGVWAVNNAPIKGTNSVIPMLMCVGQDWEWPMERVNISDCYGSWKAWTQSNNPTSVVWYGTAATDRHRLNVVQRWKEETEEDKWPEE